MDVSRKRAKDKSEEVGSTVTAKVKGAAQEMTYRGAMMMRSKKMSHKRRQGP